MTDFTVGALAARTGLTVRTLHHYDTIGLLSPSGRSEAGYRLYSEKDVHRLQHIVMLRSLGVSLPEIASVLSGGPSDLLRLLTEHAVALRGRAEDALALATRADHMAEHLRGHAVHSLDEGFEDIAAVRLFEEFFDAEQLDALRDRTQEVGVDAIREAESEWPRLIAAVRFEMKTGTPPDDTRVRPLAQRWRELVEMFTNGRFDIAASAGRMSHADDTVRQRTGLDMEVMEYVARATAALHD
jgi:DNA-binding transcriptional MerR regulator